MRTQAIMELSWEEEFPMPFRGSDIGWAEGEDSDEVAECLEAASGRLAAATGISLPEARGRLWGRGDFYPRLALMDVE